MIDGRPENDYYSKAAKIHPNSSNSIPRKMTSRGKIYN
jgi:hypothetical protein